MTNSKSTLQMILFLALAFFPQKSYALQELLKNFRGARSAGMGGILHTTGNYGEALFGNPARHSEVDTWKLSVLDLTAEVNTNLLSSSSEISNLKSSSGAGTISSASKLIGENQHARLQMLNAYYNPTLFGEMGVAIGLLTSAQANLTVNYTTDVDNQILIDLGPAVGLSYPFLNHTLSVGLNMRMIFRAASDGVINSLDFLTGSKLSLQNFGKQGIGFDGDLGAYYHIPWEIPFMRISLATTLSNLMKSHYDDAQVTLLNGVGPRPTQNERLVNTGVRFDFPDTWILTAPLFAIEFQDLGNSDKLVSFAKCVHLGGEAKLSRVFSLRAGLNQGYLAGGLGIDLPVVKMDLATYGEELSSNAGQSEDRRLLFRLAFEI